MIQFWQNTRELIDQQAEENLSALSMFNFRYESFSANQEKYEPN